jgi:hypothetical protein
LVKPETDLSLPTTSAGFLLGALFDLEDRGEYVRLSPNYMALQHRQLHVVFILITLKHFFSSLST